MPADLLRRRILIGEADPVHRTHLKKVLEDLGYGMEFCADGAKALEILQTAEPPFIALLDQDLPGMSCAEVCAALQGQRLEISPWIIALCKSCDRILQEPPTPDAESGASVPHAGICDVLSKPVDPLELRLRLKTAERIEVLKEELHRAVEAIGFQASHDPLTGVWNREALLPLLAQETDRVRRTLSPMTLLLIDIDHFMHRNLEYGYEACNSVLRQIASRLRRQLRSYDILGRSGEDEFLIGLCGCALEDALAMAERLRVGVLHSPFHIRNISVNVRVSIGVAESKGRSPLIVLREAERALAAAKQAGRDRVRCFEHEGPFAPVARPSLDEHPEDFSPSPITNLVAIFPHSRRNKN